MSYERWKHEAEKISGVSFGPEQTYPCCKCGQARSAMQLHSAMICRDCVEGTTPKTETYKLEGEKFVRVADKNAADADRYQRLLAVLVDEYRCRFHQTRTKFLLRDMAAKAGIDLDEELKREVPSESATATPTVRVPPLSAETVARSEQGPAVRGVQEVPHGHREKSR